MSENDGTIHPSRVRTDIYLCKGCREEFTPGDDVVGVVDGIVNGDETFVVANRRLWHRYCYPDPGGSG